MVLAARAPVSLLPSSVRLEFILFGAIICTSTNTDDACRTFEHEILTVTSSSVSNPSDDRPVCLRQALVETSLDAAA